MIPENHQSTVALGIAAEPRWVRAVDAKRISAASVVVTIELEPLRRFGRGKTVKLYLNNEDAAAIAAACQAPPPDATGDLLAACREAEEILSIQDLPIRNDTRQTILGRLQAAILKAERLLP